MENLNLKVTIFDRNIIYKQLIALFSMFVYQRVQKKKKKNIAPAGPGDGQP